jgi:hypothetical protein
MGLAFVSSSRAFLAHLVFCGGYRGSISAANAEGQDELIEPENSHLRIMRNRLVHLDFAPRSQPPTTSIAYTLWLTGFVCLRRFTASAERPRLPNDFATPPFVPHSLFWRQRTWDPSATAGVAAAPRLFSLRILCFSGQQGCLVNRVSWSRQAGGTLLD